MPNITQELIPIIKQGYDEQFADARTLHQFLESGHQFADWIKSRIEIYGFIEGRDFFRNSRKSTGGRQAIDYTITIDMAKELGMIENNEKGRQIRQYFIQKEKEARRLQAALLSGMDEVQALLNEVDKIEQNGFLWYASSQLRRLSGKASMNGYQVKLKKLVAEKKAMKVLRRNSPCWYVREDALSYLLSVNHGTLLAASIVKLLNAGGISWLKQ